MLIKDKLDVPQTSNQSNAFSWVALALIVGFMALSLQDMSRDYFALDITETITELIALVFIIGSVVGLVTMIAMAIGKTLELDPWVVAGCAVIALAPMTIFLIYAHLVMSNALAPAKNSFRQMATALSCRGSGCERSRLETVLKHRDALLRDFGYIRIGAWHVDHDDVDCNAVYLYTAGLYTQRPNDRTNTP